MKNGEIIQLLIQLKAFTIDLELLNKLISGINLNSFAIYNLNKENLGLFIQ